MACMIDVSMPLVCQAHPGQIALEFTRTAASAQAAMTSALADVKRAIPFVQLIEAMPDFVGLSDAAGVGRMAAACSD